MFVHAEQQVHLGGTGVDLLRSHGQAGQGDRFPAGLLDVHHHLEQRVAVQRPPRVERLDDAVEGDVAVRVRAQVGLPDPGQQRAEPRPAGRVGPQHQRVDEATDDVV